MTCPPCNQNCKQGRDCPSKFSPIARKTALVAFILCSWVYLYGMGFSHGKLARLTLDQVIDTCKAQFFDALELKQKGKK